jgi:hypothetical protein
MAIRKRRIVNYGGKPIKVGKTLQKFVTRYEKTSPEVPDAVKEYLSLTEEEKRKARHRNSLPADALRIFMETVGLDITASITDADHVSWIGFEHGVVRIDLSEKDERDRVQYFNGPRYLYDDNNRVEFLLSDNRKGIWVLTESGVSHIELKPLSYTEKAVRMSAVSQEYVNRRGVVSESRLSEGRWVPTVTDNDGLWTSMYAAGECFRYAVETDPARKEIARRIAVASTEAVLLIANISSRDGFTDAKIRHYINTFINPHNEMSKEYVKKGGDPVYLYPEEGPAGMTLEKLLLSVHEPRTKEDWVTEGEGETKRAHLRGFIARTYLLEGLEQVPTEGIFFKKMIKDGKIIAKARPFDPGLGPDDPNRREFDDVNRRARMTEDFSGLETDASFPLPERLAKLYRSVPKADGTYFSDTDVYYKADTSSDEIIGHLFLYKIAYDTLCEGENADTELGGIITDTVLRLAEHVLFNDYCLVDATGQPTTWGKMSREYFNSLFAWSDCPLNCLVLLCIFKLAYYLSGDEKWEKEYRKLALEPPYRYADLAGEYRERYKQEAVYQYRMAHPDADENDPNLDPDSKETAIRVQLILNYSDEEMAMLAYYLLFQLETDPFLLEKYRKGIDAWWISIRYGDNPLWTYIYRLAYPDTVGQEDLEKAAWALKRHPVDTRNWRSDHSFRKDLTILYGSRKRAFAFENKESGRFVALPLDERPHGKYNGCPFVMIGGDKEGRQLESSATYTLPYWLGRFHGMIEE